LFKANFTYILAALSGSIFFDFFFENLQPREEKEVDKEDKRQGDGSLVLFIPFVLHISLPIFVEI